MALNKGLKLAAQKILRKMHLKNFYKPSKYIDSLLCKNRGMAGTKCNKPIEVCTVVNTITHTSMPINEFVRYRVKSNKNERHVLISLEDGEKEITGSLAKSIDVVTCGGSLLKFSTVLSSNFKQNKIERVYHFHQPKTATLAIFPQLLFRRNNNSVFTVHSLYSKYGLINKVLFALASLNAGYVAFVSDAAYSDFPKILKKLFGRKAGVIRNGVDLSRIDEWLEETKKGIEYSVNCKKERGRQLHAVMVGRLVEAKNYELALSIIKEVKNIRCIIVGDGAERQRIERKIKNLGLEERVKLTGTVAREKVYELMFSADVMITTSKYEGLPIAVLEGMAMKLPVLASDISPHREISNFTKGVVLVDLNDKSNWISILQNMMRQPVNVLADMGEKNRGAIISEFGIDKMHKGYTRIYKKLAGA